MRGCSEVAGVASPGHAFKWTSREPRRARYLSRTGRIGSARPEWNQVPRGMRASQGSEQTLSVGYLPPRETGGDRDGQRAVVRTHSTCEGGEPQGSRKGRPRYPLEGRGEQVDASTRSRIRETQNSRTDVKWNTVD